MAQPDEIASMLTELDRQPAPAPRPAPVKLPQPDASYALPGAPERSQPTHRARKPTRSYTWVQRVTGEDLMEQAKPKASTYCCGRVSVPLPTAWMSSRRSCHHSWLSVFSPRLVILLTRYLSGHEEEQAVAYRAFLNDLPTTNDGEAVQTLLSYTGRSTTRREGAEFFDNGQWGAPRVLGLGCSLRPSTLRCHHLRLAADQSYRARMAANCSIIYSLIGIPFA